MPIASIFALRAINSPRHAPDRGTDIFLKFPFCPASLYIFFSLLNTKKPPKNTPKNTSKFLDFCISTKNTRYYFLAQSSFPWFYILDLGFRGVDIAFNYHPHP